MQNKAIQTIVGFAGGNTQYNTGRMFITLKPLNERKEAADRIIARLRKKLAVVPGATLYMQSAQDLTIGGRQSQAQFQYTLQGENLDDLNNWSPRLLQKLRTLPDLRDVNTDQQDKGLEAQVIIDRDTAERSIGFPSTIKASFQGTAAAFQQSLANEPILILAALATVYIVLGVLYESYIHPITILSTLPSAGVGAILALKLIHNELNVMGLIGIILLI